MKILKKYTLELTAEDFYRNYDNNLEQIIEYYNKVHPKRKIKLKFTGDEKKYGELGEESEGKLVKLHYLLGKEKCPREIYIQSDWWWMYRINQRMYRGIFVVIPINIKDEENKNINELNGL